jgi:hypothetical protein
MNRLGWKRMGDGKPTEKGWYVLYCGESRLQNLAEVIDEKYHDEWLWLGPLPAPDLERNYWGRPIAPEKEIQL